MGTWGRAQTSASVNTPRLPVPGPTQTYSSLFNATNHLGAGPVNPLCRQTAEGLASARLSIHKALLVSTATPLGPPGVALAGELVPCASWFPLAYRCCRAWKLFSPHGSVFLCTESESLSVFLWVYIRKKRIKSDTVFKNQVSRESNFQGPLPIWTALGSRAALGAVWHVIARLLCCAA